ncbi:MAG: hypothetical protein JSR71_09550 [Proteobacteria bacterium]|nr:hypothetical protein [Pseudomonadota bacterium]
MANKDSTSNRTTPKVCKAAPEAPKVRTRRKTKSQTIYPLSQYEIKHRTRANQLRELNEYIASLSDAEKRVVGHVCPYGDPIAGMNEMRRLLGESIAKCKVISFPVAGTAKQATL